MKRALPIALLAGVAALIAAFAWFALRSPGGMPSGVESPLAAPAAPRARSPDPAAPLAFDESRAPAVTADAADEFERRRTATPTPAATTVQSLAGRVLSPSAPIAGAEVVLSAADGSELARARTDGGGQFFLALDAPVENAALLVRAKGYAASLRSGERVQRGERRNLGVLRLDPGVTVAGRVVDAQDAPIPGASVELRGPALAGIVQRPLAATVTDRDGRFAFGDAPQAQVRIEARASGYGARAIEPVDAPADDVVVRMPAELVLRVRAVDRRTRAPIAGVRIELAALDKLAPAAAGTTDANGVASIGGLGAQSWAARVQAPNYRARSEARIDAGAAEFLLELDAWPCVRGVVRTADGSVPSEIAVRLRATDASGGAIADAQPRASGRCDPDGRFALCDLRPGIYVLEASASGWATRCSVPFVLALERDAPEQVLVLATGATVSARVVALRGELRDAHVEAHSAPPGETELLQYELGASGADGGALNGASMRRIASAPVGADGTARLEHLPDGPVWIVARSRDHLAEVRGPFHLDARESSASVEFDLAPGARVRGRVLLGAQPVAGALVILRRPNAPGLGALRAVANERGEFVSPLLPAGTWKLVARRLGGNDGTRSAEASVEVVGGGEATVDLDLSQLDVR
jgi:hypothetical protein